MQPFSIFRAENCQIVEVGTYLPEAFWFWQFFKVVRLLFVAAFKAVFVAARGRVAAETFFFLPGVSLSDPSELGTTRAGSLQ